MTFLTFQAICRLNDGPRRKMRGRSRSRSQSRNRNQQTGSIIDRLGARQPRGRMRRGSAVANGGQQQQRGRSRTRSRVRLNRNNFSNNRNANNQAPLRRSNSVNARLGNNGPTQIRRRRRFVSQSRNPNTQLNKPIGGRIVKRNTRNPIGARIQRNIRRNGNANALGANARRGKIVKRWIKIWTFENNLLDDEAF